VGKRDKTFRLSRSLISYQTIEKLEEKLMK